MNKEIKNKTLLEKALEVKRGRRLKRDVSEEEIEVALAWMVGKVGVTQVCVAMGKKKAGTILYRIAVVLREAYTRGKLKIV